MVLLERDLHLKALRSALSEADTEGRVVLVYGEAGIGKTSLVEHFAQENKSSWRILSGACDSLFTPRPLGPLHDIAFQTQGSLRALLDSESNRGVIFSECLNELKTQRTILVIEDIHWADEATLDLLKYLGRRIRQTTSLMILTYRDDELGANHPLRFLLGDLASSYALHRISVPSLSRDAVENLTKGKNVDWVELHRLTNGNPFFVTEVLAVESGIPETVREAVLARAARLSAAALSLLEVAAVIGLRVEPWLLSKISNSENADVEECIARGTLQLQGEYYAFRHELARQTILESIFPQRKITLHRMALNALKESPETRNDSARLANHAEGTKDANAVLEYAPTAAKQASAAGAHRQAATLYELILRYADVLPTLQHAQMLEAYADEQWYQRHVESFIESFIPVRQEIIEKYHLLGNPLREGMNLAILASELQSLGRDAESDEAIQAALVILEVLPPSMELARVYGAQCYVLNTRMNYMGSVVAGEKAVALAEQLGDMDIVSRAGNIVGSTLISMGDERGPALMQRCLTIAREHNLDYAIGMVLGNWLPALVGTFQFEEARRILQEAKTHASQSDDDYHTEALAIDQALIEMYQGNWDETTELLAQVGQRPASKDARAYETSVRGRHGVRYGDTSAQQRLHQALAWFIELQALEVVGIVQGGLAEAAWLRDDNQQAITEARAVYDLYFSQHIPWVTGELAFWRWRAGDEFTPPDWIAKPYAFQIAGDWRGAAEEWKRIGCPYEQASALMDGDEAGQLAALEIFERLGARPIIEKLKGQMRAQGIRIPRGPRPATRENPYGLTAREIEVLACLVKGSSNNAIARQLSLSTRTVEHHIASILQKMRVESRAEAVVLAIKDNLLSSS